MTAAMESKYRVEKYFTRQARGNIRNAGLLGAILILGSCLIWSSCLILSGCLFFSGCTVAKPVACAVAYPPQVLLDRFESNDDASDDYKELPPAALIPAAIVLIPFNYAYWTVHSAVGGLFSGFISDLNMMTGHADWDSTMDTMLEPLHTNALAPD